MSLCNPAPVRPTMRWGVRLPSIRTGGFCAGCRLHSERRFDRSNTTQLLPRLLLKAPLTARALHTVKVLRHLFNKDTAVSENANQAHGCTTALPKSGEVSLSRKVKVATVELGRGAGCSTSSGRMLADAVLARGTTRVATRYSRQRRRIHSNRCDRRQIFRHKKAETNIRQPCR